MKKLIALLLAVLINQLVSGQHIYERYQAVSGNIKHVMHLIKTDQQLSATVYTIDMQSDVAERSDLTGGLEVDSRFVLSAYGQEGIVIEGSFQDNKILAKIPGGHTPHYHFESAYPEGSIKLDYYHRKAGITLDDQNIFSPKAGFETALLFPESVNSKVLYATLLDFYRINLPEPKPVEEIIIDEQNRFFDQYVRMNIDLDHKGSSLNWERSQQLQVLLNEHGLLCIEKAGYAYTGGAHGLTNVQYLVADIRTGKALSVADIFHEEAEARLTQRISSKVRERYAIPADQKLTEAGFFVDEVSPNQNFFIGLNGIGFYYNNYDIAPYALGHTMVFFTFEDISDMMKPGSIVYQMVAKRFNP